MTVDEQWDKSGATAAPEPASSPPQSLDSSLLLLAKDLMPPSDAVAPPPEVPDNVDRHVRALPVWTRAWRWLRSYAVKGAHKLRLDRLAPRQRWIVGGAARVLLIAIVAALASSAADLGQHARGLVANGQYRDGLASYAALLMRHPRAAADHDVSADLGRIADAADPATATTALDVLALQVGGPGSEELLARTTSRSSAVRHHAFALAESEGLGDRIDRVASWMLDLEQATNCDQRRAIVAKIAATHDKRLASAQREASHYNCGSSAPSAPSGPSAPSDPRPASRSKPAPTASGTHRPKPHW